MALLIDYRVVVFAVIAAAWFASFFVLITCLCKAARDDLGDHFDSIPATVRLGHEALPLRPEDRDAEIARLEEWVGQ